MLTHDQFQQARQYWSLRLSLGSLGFCGRVLFLILFGFNSIAVVFAQGLEPPVTRYNAAVEAGFAGHSAVLDAGLINMGGRHYDPVSGRFISPDPFTTDPSVDIGWNRYVYVGNNPLNRTDPSGFAGIPELSLTATPPDNWGGWPENGGAGGGGVGGPAYGGGGIPLGSGLKQVWGKVKNGFKRIGDGFRRWRASREARGHGNGVADPQFVAHTQNSAISGSSAFQDAPPVIANADYESIRTPAVMTDGGRTSLLDDSDYYRERRLALARVEDPLNVTASFSDKLQASIARDIYDTFDGVAGDNYGTLAISSVPFDPGHFFGKLLKGFPDGVARYGRSPARRPSNNTGQFFAHGNKAVAQIDPEKPGVMVLNFLADSDTHLQTLSQAVQHFGSGVHTIRYSVLMPNDLMALTSEVRNGATLSGAMRNFSLGGLAGRLGFSKIRHIPKSLRVNRVGRYTGVTFEFSKPVTGVVP